MKKILMIATGGTIASRPTEAGLAPAISPEELVAYVPEIAGCAEVHTIQPFCLDSTNLSPAHWLTLERAIEENYAAFDGFVITHGTDTLAYTAAALGYLVQNSPKPIVLTGSQKSVYLRDTDARRNLADAFFYCADGGACGVKVVFDGNVILGSRARKTRTRSFNAFSSVDYPPVAVMRDGAPYYFIPPSPAGGAPSFYRALDRNVFVLKLIPGIRADVFDYLDRACNALIVESFGAGGLPDYGDGELLARVKAFAAEKPVVFATQVEREGSSLDTYEVGRKLRSIGRVLEARTMTLEATLSKLMWLLPQAQGEELERRFYEPVDHDLL